MELVGSLQYSQVPSNKVFYCLKLLATCSKRFSTALNFINNSSEICLLYIQNYGCFISNTKQFENLKREFDIVFSWLDLNGLEIYGP